MGVGGFWSLTVYNKEHLIEPNPPNRFSLGTESKSMKQNSNGSLALYFQSKSPGSDKESNWVPTPTDRFSLYTGACWSKEYRLRQTSDSGKMSANGVRREKAALSSGCKSHPATAPAGSNRSSYGGNEVAEAFG